ncbi:GNAT family N-acetyltransferase [Cereibacter sphaeroides]|uniref:GNAT family N-acetyltransferase n=1 Tax=Cereibacter sphaeroides TaxID=1063 RepID=UPI001F483CC1|nr:GNAT family N-acetyltransferase [Cereibacter sphaeroides]MCE6958391.1 GNAT family N-acetyltransferase [Cereibacter sphaeroides]MCE6972258.1 GNAT family N-acetyltransferase [Cereibacter sphaeroides]
MTAEAMLDELGTRYFRKSTQFQVLSRGRCVARMILSPQPGLVDLELIWVAPGARGRGIGGRLLHDVVESADRHQVAVSLALVESPFTEPMERLEAWYGRAGFRVSPQHCTGDDIVLCRPPALPAPAMLDTDELSFA